MKHKQNITEISPRHHQSITKTSLKQNWGTTGKNWDITQTMNTSLTQSQRHHRHITKASPRQDQHITDTSPKPDRHITDTNPGHHRDITDTPPRQNRDITKNITKTSLKHHWNSTETSRRHPRDKTTQLRPPRNIQNSTNYTETTPRHHRDKEASSVDIRPTAFCHSYTGLPRKVHNIQIQIGILDFA